MRYGVFSDVHGNLPALEAAVEALESRGIEAWLCAGDLVGYGASPNECIARVRALGAKCVAGNHDLIAVGALSDDRCIPLARESLAWTRRVLSPESRAYLERLPARIETEPGIVVAHGSLDDPERYVARAADQLAELALLAPGMTLVLGHTHRPALRRAGASLFLNPGAVGQSRDRRLRARFAIIDTEAKTAELLAADYDRERAEAALAQAGLSDAGLHLKPSLLRSAARRLKERL
jgi:putative phosphoesterase